MDTNPIQNMPAIPATPVSMPTNFLDAMQNQTTELSQPGQAVGVDSGATSRATQILQAKSGKQVNPAGLAQSNVQEQVAGQVAGNQLQNQIQPQLQLQQAQTQQQTQAQAAAAQNQQAQIQQTNQYNTAQAKLQLADITQTMNQGFQQLSTDKQAALLQQAAFLMNMQNQQYVTKLQQVGQITNLTSKAAMQDQIQNIIFGSNVNTLQTQLGQQNVLQASTRDFNQAMANMSYQEAQRIADMETINRQQMEQLQAQQLQYGASLQSNLSSIGALGQGISGTIGGIGQAVQAVGNQQDRTQAAQDRQTLSSLLSQQGK